MSFLHMFIVLEALFESANLNKKKTHWLSKSYAILSLFGLISSRKYSKFPWENKITDDRLVRHTSTTN